MQKRMPLSFITLMFLLLAQSVVAYDPSRDGDQMDEGNTGVVRSIHVHENQMVNEGELIAVVEIGSVENRIIAHEGGLVTKIYFSPGQRVQSDQFMVDMIPRSVLEAMVRQDLANRTEN